jgi:hypothetical protein
VGLQLPTGIDDLELLFNANGELLRGHENLPGMAAATRMPT